MLHFDKTEDFKQTFLSIFTEDCCPVYLKLTKNEENPFEHKLCELFDFVLKLLLRIMKQNNTAVAIISGANLEKKVCTRAITSAIKICQSIVPIYNSAGGGGMP